MKKLLFLLLLSVTVQAQTYQNPTFGTVTTKTNIESTTATKINAQESDGKINWLQPINIPIPTAPVNYSVSAPTLGANLSGIDTRLGQISSTSAGLTNRIWLTADNTVVNAVTYFASSALGKGSTAAGSPPNLVLADNTKGYFTKDLISIPQPAATIGYAGSYSGNLTVSATPTPVATQQRFTVEVYRTDNLGVPIASGVSGAPVGDLGVTVVAILDSGIINLTAGSITNVTVNGILTQNITINTGERLRYHVSAAKIGSGGGNVTFGVYYGSSYNSYYDVPVAITTDAVLNKSTVTGVTATDALNTLNAKIPNVYTTTVYVNSTSPNSATIFDDVNPPVVNDNSLKANVNNLYIGTDASGWVYNASTLNYVTKTVTSVTSNFYLSGTTTDAGSSKTASIYRTGTIGIGTSNLGIAPLEVLGVNNNRIIYGRNSLSPTAGVTMEQGIALSGSKLEGEASLNDGYSLAGYNVNPTSSLAMFSQVAQSADTGTFPLNIIQANKLTDSGITASSIVNRPILGVSNYNTRLMTMQPNGNTLFLGTLTANSFLKTGATATDALLAGGSTLSNPINGSATTGDIPVFSGTRTLAGSTGISIVNSVYSMFNIKGSGTGNTGGGSIQFRNQNTLFAEIAGETESANNGVLYFRSLTGGVSTEKGSISSSGVWKLNNLAGIGTRTVVADASGNLSATSSSALDSGTYTPTLTSGTNIPTVTLRTASYSKIGNIVTVYASISIVATSGNTGSDFTMSVPFNKTTTTNYYVGSGFSTISGIPPIGGEVAFLGSASSITFTFKTGSTVGSSNFVNLSFQYNTAN